MTLHQARVANPIEGSAAPRSGIAGFALLQSPLFQLQGLILLAIVLGGGGLAYGTRNLVIQLCALAILAANPAAAARFVSQAPRFLIGLVLASLTLPLVQLIPLPPEIWQSLPGREQVVESFAIAGFAADRWVPVSLDPMRSLVAFCGTLAPAAIIVIGTTLPREDKLALVRVTLLGCAAAFVLGVVQLASANTSGLLYAERTVADVFYATFTNRNSTALFFVIALALLMALPLPRKPIGLAIGAVLAVLFILAAVLTQSRSGMVLLAITAAFALLRLGFVLVKARSNKALRPNRALAFVLAAAVLMVTALGLSLASGGRVADGMDRFTQGAADRPEMWDDSLYAAQQYWPAGSGMGTFDEVFQLHESLEHVSPRKAGRAHSDWLEIAIEGGALSLLIAVGWLGWCLFAALPRGSREGIWMRTGAGVALGCIALQSLLDYPLRNQTMLCLAALCIVMLVRPREVTE